MEASLLVARSRAMLTGWASLASCAACSAASCPAFPSSFSGARRGRSTILRSVGSFFMSTKLEFILKSFILLSEENCLYYHAIIKTILLKIALAAYRIFVLFCPNIILPTYSFIKNALQDKFFIVPIKKNSSNQIQIANYRPIYKLNYQWQASIHFN